jgi:DtxR family Mn-dependent transcriptional regulator
MENPTSPWTERRRLDLSESQEDYLKQIFLLGEGGTSVSTQSLADRLNVRPASVTGMVRRLAESGFVDHRRYHGVRLTDLGRQVALEVLRHHRLLETFLARALGYSWDEVHEEAERLEHVISDRFEARMAEILGHPTRDPHGDPIPDSSLTMPGLGSGRRLTELASGMSGRLVRVSAQDRDSLNLLARIGLTPGTAVVVRESTGSEVRIEVVGGQYLVPWDLAGELWLEEEWQ